MSPGRFGTQKAAQSGVRNATLSLPSTRHGDLGQYITQHHLPTKMNFEIQPHLAEQRQQQQYGSITVAPPTDQRWQPSRGIQFSNGGARKLNDFTRTSCDSIRSAVVRHSSTKAGPLPRSAYQSSPSPKSSATSKIDASHKSTAFNFVSVGGSVADLKINQQKLQTENEKLANHIKEAQQELDNLKLDLKVQVERLKQDLVSEAKHWSLENERLKELNSEHQAKSEELLSDWESQLQVERDRVEASFRDELATKTKIVSNLQHRLNRLEKEQSEAFAQSQQAAEGLVAGREVEREVEHRQAILKLRNLQAESESAQAAAQKARHEIDRRLKLERDRFNQQLYRRDSGRTDYERYNAHFSQFHDILWEFLPVLNSRKRMETSRLENYDALRLSWEEFTGRVPKFLHKYPQLNKNVARLTDESQKEIEQRLYDLETQLVQLNKERRALQVEGHRSRYMTRRLRYNSFAGDALYDLTSPTAADAAIQLQREHWKSVERDSKAQIMVTKSASKRIELKALEKQAMAHMQSLQAIGNCIKKSRKVQTLRDLLKDPHEYKRAFIASAAASEQIEDAIQDWRRYSALRRSELDRMYSGSDLDRLAVDFASKYRAAVLATEAFQSLMHRLALLESDLDEVSLPDTELDMQINQRIAKLIEGYPLLRTVLGHEVAFHLPARSKSLPVGAKRPFTSNTPLSSPGANPKLVKQQARGRKASLRRRTFHTTSFTFQVAGTEASTSTSPGGWPCNLTFSQYNSSPEGHRPSNGEAQKSNEECEVSQYDALAMPQGPSASLGEDTSEMSSPVRGETHDEVPNLTFKLVKNTDGEDGSPSEDKPLEQSWKYNLYLDPSGKAPSRHYCTTYEQAESQAAHFLNDSVVGFDLEWDSRAIAGKSNIKRLVSLIQIASESRIGLFQVSLFRGSGADELMPPTLRKILESPSVIKAGVNVAGDATRMSKHFGVEMRGLFELSHLYKLVNYPKYPLNKRLVGLATIVRDEFSMPLPKDDVRMSNWTQKLDNEQIDYACSDAYAGFQLFHSLERKRRRMEPRPPRPAFHELRLPLMLPDGTAIQPKAQAKDQATAVMEDDEGDNDEFVDAVETQEQYELAPEVSRTDLKHPEVSQGLKDGAIDSNDNDAHVASDISSRGKTSNSDTTPSLSMSSHIQEADGWVREFRASLPEGHGCKGGDTKQSVFRTYHIWHVQGLDIQKTAAMLRNPPFSKTTVASYIFQAISEGNLPFDPARIKELVEVLPLGARFRYQRIIARAIEGDI